MEIPIHKRNQTKITNTKTSRCCYSYDCITGCPHATVQEGWMEGMRHPRGLPEEEQVDKLSSGQEVEY